MQDDMEPGTMNPIVKYQVQVFTSGIMFHKWKREDGVWRSKWTSEQGKKIVPTKFANSRIKYIIRVKKFKLPIW